MGHHESNLDMEKRVDQLAYLHQKHLLWMLVEVAILLSIVSALTGLGMALYWRGFMSFLGSIIAGVVFTVSAILWLAITFYLRWYRRCEVITWYRGNLISHSIYFEDDKDRPPGK